MAGHTVLVCSLGLDEPHRRRRPSRQVPVHLTRDLLLSVIDVDDELRGGDFDGLALSIAIVLS